MRADISSLRLNHNKHTAASPSHPIAPPKEVLLSLSMHAGTPAVPEVEDGQHVYLGQRIARAGEKISSPVHATVSGTVRGIERYTQADGSTVSAIRIESDGKMERDPALKAPVVADDDVDGFLEAVKESGIVGLGGAAFPLWMKLDAIRSNHIHTVLVNGAECEPYITSDHRMMVEHTDLVVKGIHLLRRFMKSEHFVICIEKNKPDAIEKLQQAFADDPGVEIRPLRTLYPQGAKQVLLYNVTGQVVKGGQRLATLAVIIINVSTLSKLAQYFEDGTPLVDRIVTVDGSAIREAQNLIAPIGTPVDYLLEQAGGLSCEAGKIIVGGPMLGTAISSLSEPIPKAVSAVLALDEKAARLAEPSDCIRCGRCVANCPISLNPSDLADAMEQPDEDERYRLLKKLSVNQCIECACCSYVCPAHKPLMELNKQGKQFVRQYRKTHPEKGGN